MSLLATGVIVARLFGPGQFGLYTFYIAVCSISLTGLVSGLSVYVVRQTASQQIGAETLGLLLALTVCLLTAGAAITVMLSVLIAPTGADWKLTGIAVLAFSTVALVNFFSAVRVATGQVTRAALGETLCGLGGLFATVLATVAHLGLAGVLAGIGVGGISGTLLLFERLVWRVSLQEVVAQAREAGAFLALGLANVGVARIDLVLITAIGSQKALADYAAAYRLLGIIALLSSSFGTAFFARLSALDHEIHEWDAFRIRGGKLFLGLVCVTVAAGLLGAGYIVQQLFGARYEGAVQPARILLLSGIPLALYWPSAHVLNAVSAQKSWLRILLASLVFDGILVCATVGRGGADAAAGAWVATEVFTMVLVRRKLNRILGDRGVVAEDSSASMSQPTGGVMRERVVAAGTEGNQLRAEMNWDNHDS